MANIENENYIAYLTANDDKIFIADYLNLKNMVKYYPGVQRVNLIIGISEVKPKSIGDTLLMQKLINIIKMSTWINLVGVDVV